MGAREDFTAFAVAREPALLRLAWALTGNRHSAQDLAQQSFVQLWSKWHVISLEQDPWPYLQRIAINLSLSWRRRRRFSSEILTDEFEASSEAATRDMQIETRQMVASWLSRLPARQRAAVTLRYMLDIPVSEVAALLGCSEGTVKSQSSRALAALRKSVEEHHLSPEEVLGI